MDYLNEKGRAAMATTSGHYIQRATEELSKTLTSKNADYRTSGEFSNFASAATTVVMMTGQIVGTEEIIAAQIGIKLGRLHGLPVDPNNESRLDTLKDLAGYAIILYAHALSLADEVDPFSQ